MAAFEQFVVALAARWMTPAASLMVFSLTGIISIYCVGSICFYCIVFETQPYEGTPFRMDPVKPRKLADEVQERLLRLIHESGLRPGDTLPSERELMQALNVGRPSVREALQNLNRMGLLDIRHGERTRISEPSLGRMFEPMAETIKHILSHVPASLEHLKEARAIFEMEMARNAARKRSKADIERLSNLLERQRKARKDPPLFVELDGAFHREIAVVSGNPIFVTVEG